MTWSTAGASSTPAESSCSARRPIAAVGDVVSTPALSNAKPIPIFLSFTVFSNDPWTSPPDDGTFRVLSAQTILVRLPTPGVVETVFSLSTDLGFIALAEAPFRKLLTPASRLAPGVFEAVLSNEEDEEEDDEDNAKGSREHGRDARRHAEKLVDVLVG